MSHSYSRIRPLLAALLVLGCSPAALAVDDAVVAEHQRLSDQLKTLAERNAWSGVDRTFQQLQELGVEPTAGEWRIAALASATAGDAGTAHDRYAKSLEVEADDGAAHAVSDYTTNYGRVELLCKPGTVDLQIDERPFQPDRARAVDFATLAVTEQGTFDGMLPEAVYTFGPYSFAVIPGQDKATFDTRRLHLDESGEGVEQKAARLPKPTREPVALPFRVPLAGGAAGSAVVAGVLYGVAAGKHRAWEETNTRAELEPLRSQTNGLLVGAGVLGAAAVGLGVTSFTVDARF